MDMPLEKLRKYRGSTPKPADFDSYWERALKELDGTELRPVLVPGPMQTPFAECFDLWFNGVGGARIHAHYVRPKKREKPCPAVLCFHGYGGNCGDWWEKPSATLLGDSVQPFWIAGGRAAPRRTRAAFGGIPFTGI